MSCICPPHVIEISDETSNHLVFKLTLSLPLSLFSLSGGMCVYAVYIYIYIYMCVYRWCVANTLVLHRMIMVLVIGVSNQCSISSCSTMSISSSMHYDWKYDNGATESISAMKYMTNLTPWITRTLQKYTVTVTALRSTSHKGFSLIFSQ